MRHGVRGCRDGGVAECHEAEQGHSEDGVRAQVGWGGVSCAARHARVGFKCLRARRAERGGSARERERRERKGVEREIKVSGLTWFKLEIFN